MNHEIKTTLHKTWTWKVWTLLELPASWLKSPFCPVPPPQRGCMSQGHRATCSCSGEQLFTHSQRSDHTSRCRSEFTCPRRARKPIHLHPSPHSPAAALENEEVVVVVVVVVGGHGGQKNGPTPTVRAKGLPFLILQFSLTKVYWQSSIISTGFSASRMNVTSGREKSPAKTLLHRCWNLT